MSLHSLEPPPMMVTEPPATSEPVTLDSALAPGADVFVNLGGILYPGKVARVAMPPGEVAVETTAARHMSRQWKTLLFYCESRRSVYGLATLVIPGLDEMPAEMEIRQTYEKHPPTNPSPLDEPEALSREDDDESWEQASTLTEDEQEELWK